MASPQIPIRAALPGDVPGMFLVRTSVTENLISAKKLEKMGITPAAVAESLKRDSKAWVAKDGTRLVAFSIADRSTGTIFALFVLPQYENRGLGTRLLKLAVNWLTKSGVKRITLTTAPHTKAAAWYAKRGWQHVSTEPNGELRLELQHAG